jgi:DNA-binding transcriptional LysR family regulator
MPTRIDASILAALRCFEAAGRYLSFTQAAASLNLTQSAVSQQVRQLEERLGYRLFVRQARGLALTSNGTTLHAATTKTFAELNHVLQQLDEPESVSLEVSCLPSFALQWLMPRLADFHRNCPGVSVKLKAEFDSLTPRKLEQRGIDAAVRYLPSAEVPAGAHILLDEFLVVAASPTYLRRQPPTEMKAWFDGITVLHDEEPWEGAPECVEWQTWLGEVMPPSTQQIEGPRFNLSSLAISAALNHQGVVLGRTALIADEVRAGHLLDVFKRPVRAPARYVLMLADQEKLHANAFAEWLRHACASFDQDRRELFSIS